MGLFKDSVTKARVFPLKFKHACQLVDDKSNSVVSMTASMCLCLVQMLKTVFK